MTHKFESNQVIVLNSEMDNNILTFVGTFDGKAAAFTVTMKGNPIPTHGDELLDEIADYHVEYADLVDEQIKLQFGIEMDPDNGDETWV